MKTTLIGVSGNSRVGKDTLARILKKIIFNSETFSLAFYLRKETEKTLKKFNHNVWTQNGDLKSAFRLYLVEYAELARKYSHGQYFWKKLYKDIKKTNFNYAIITDVRYDEYERDEVFWVKSNGILVYLTAKDSSGNVVGPANYKEQQNAPKLATKCDLCFNWNLTNPTLTDEEIYKRYKVEIDDLAANCIIKTK